MAEERETETQTQTQTQTQHTNSMDKTEGKNHRKQHQSKERNYGERKKQTRQWMNRTEQKDKQNTQTQKRKDWTGKKRVGALHENEKREEERGQNIDWWEEKKRKIISIQSPRNKSGRTARKMSRAMEGRKPCINPFIPENNRERERAKERHERATRGRWATTRRKREWTRTESEKRQHR